MRKSIIIDKDRRIEELNKKIEEMGELMAEKNKKLIDFQLMEVYTCFFLEQNKIKFFLIFRRKYSSPRNFKITKEN